MSSYRVYLHDNFDSLRPQSAVVDELARGNPFLQWDWLESWWRNYGHNGLRLRPNHRLLLLSFWEGPELVGVAPWYLTQTIAEGSAIRMLGSGETCGDYLTLLSHFENARDVAEAAAVWLWEAPRNGYEWDLFEVNGTLPGDVALSTLAGHLADGNCRIESPPLMSGWRIDLECGWEGYLAKLSKSHRKDLRRFQRALEAGEYTAHHLQHADQFDDVWRMFIDLHTRRRNSLGEPGCFASARFAAMHEELARKLLQQDRLELSWVEYNGTPIAVDYQFRTGGGLYAYQSGVDPDRLDLEPGRISMVATLWGAIQRGDRFLDLLRGDEPYKPHWRAEPRQLVTLRIVPNRLLSRCRYQLSTAGDTMKRWLKNGWRDWFTTSGANAASQPQH